MVPGTERTVPEAEKDRVAKIAIVESAREIGVEIGTRG